MKANPLMIIIALFAIAIAGRALGMANAAVDRGNDTEEAAPEAAARSPAGRTDSCARRPRSSCR